MFVIGQCSTYVALVLAKPAISRIVRTLSLQCDQIIGKNSVKSRKNSVKCVISQKSYLYLVQSPKFFLELKVAQPDSKKLSPFFAFFLRFQTKKIMKFQILKLRQK